MLEEMFSMTENHGRNHREELLFNSGESVQKTLYSISQESTPEQIKDILLRNHSNLKTPSQCTSAYQSIRQKPDETLQTYNTRYESYYQLAHPGLNIDNDASRVSCIHYTSSLHGKLRQVNEVNHIDISNDYQEFEVNESHVRNPNYKGKNYNPNYQKNKQNMNYDTNNSNQSSSRYKGNNYNSGGNSTMLRMTTQRSHQMLKLLSRGL